MGWFRTFVLGGLIALMSVSCAPTLQRHIDDTKVVHTININYNNVHLVTGRFGAFLIDAGTLADAPDLAQKIRLLGVDPASLKAVIVTHGHADHAGGARHFQEQFRVPIVAGAGDLPMLHAGANDRLCPTDFIARRMLDEAQAATYQKTVADRSIDQRVSLGVATGIEGLDGFILPIPGHTPGSLAVVSGNIAFVGDLFRGGLIGLGAAEHFYMCDQASNRRDIKAFINGDGRAVQTFFTGHFGPVSRTAAVSMAAGFGDAGR